MTLTSEEERAAIVRWLRSMSLYRLGLAERAGGAAAQFNDGMGQAYLNAADVIETGDHLKEPQP